MQSTRTIVGNLAFNTTPSSKHTTSFLEYFLFGVADSTIEAIRSDADGPKVDFGS